MNINVLKHRINYFDIFETCNMILQFVTLIVMWIIPFGLSLRNHWWMFIFFWLVTSCITGLIVRKAIQKPIAGTTPRYVYF